MDCHASHDAGRGITLTVHDAVFWDARDDGGARAASGVYFVRLATEGRVLTRRLTLMR